MNMFHDWLVISNLKMHPFTDHVFLLSSVISSILDLKLILNNFGKLEVDKQLNRGFDIRFKIYASDRFVVFLLSFFLVSSSMVLDLSLGERIVHSQPLVVQRILAVFRINVCC